MSSKVLSLASIRTGVLVTEDNEKISSSFDDEIVNVAKKSRELLKYDLLYNKVVIRKILYELEIEVFTRESVWDYLGLVFSRATNKKKRIVEHGRMSRRHSSYHDESSESEDEDDDVLYNNQSRGRLIIKHTSREMLDMGWIRVPIDVYGKQIPIHVLDKAVRVKETIPEGDFFVLSFEPNAAEKAIAVLDDPFLELNVGGQSYYIDVWDEPEFESKL